MNYSANATLELLARILNPSIIMVSLVDDCSRQPYNSINRNFIIAKLINGVAYGLE